MLHDCHDSSDALESPGRSRLYKLLKDGNSGSLLSADDLTIPRCSCRVASQLEGGGLLVYINIQLFNGRIEDFYSHCGCRLWQVSKSALLEKDSRVACDSAGAPALPYH